MKSLILKDLYNIGHNIKSMVLIMLVFAFLFIPSSGVEGYIIMCAVLCSTMIVTTFAFDDFSKWTRYAMVTPISKKDLVVGKFVILAIFCAGGSLFGTAVGTIGGVIAKKMSLDLAEIGNLLLMALTAWSMSLVLGSISIPLVFKFGAEKGRVFLLISFLLPAGIGFGIYKLLAALGIVLTDHTVFVLLCCSPLIALVWGFAMYQISYHIFVKKEL